MFNEQKRAKDGTYSGKRWGWKFLLLSVLIVGGWAFIQGSDWFSAKVVENMTYVAPEKKIDINIPDTKEKVEALLVKKRAELLAAIKKGEMGSYVHTPGKLVYVNDPRQVDVAKCARVGGLRSVVCDSWGELNFKITTIQHYTQKFSGQTPTEIESMLIALDPLKSDPLALDIVINEIGGIKNWLNTYNANQQYFDTTINLIRELEGVLEA